jgi:peroxiredoxin
MPGDAERAADIGPAQQSSLNPAAGQEGHWVVPPFQPLRALCALALTAGGFALYEWVLFNFWSSESLGVHERIPWAAYFLLAVALVVSLVAVRTALSIWSPHARLGFSLLALLVAAAIGFGGGRFVSYTLRGTLSPPYRLAVAVGDEFPTFALFDQKGIMHQGPASSGSKATLVYVYRGDYCPFARHEIAELNAIRPKLRMMGADVVAISADPIERSKVLSAFLHSDLPLLSDEHETVLGTLGLVQRHRNGEPDNAIQVFLLLDSGGKVRWIFASPYYRQLPSSGDLIAAVGRLSSSTHVER